MRLNRYLARVAGIGRREAENWIRQGRLRVNGEPVTHPALRLKAGDRIEIDGRLLGSEPLVYVLLRKPAGIAPEVVMGSETERGLVRTHLGVRLRPLGWLDPEAAGALVLTNDPDLLDALPPGKGGLLSLYRIESRSPISPDQVARIAEGLIDGGMRLRPERVELVEASGRVLGLEWRPEGPGLLMRLLAAAGLESCSIERLAYGGLRVHRLRMGQWRYLSEGEIRTLRRQLGLRAQPSLFVRWPSQ
nr:MAG: hypothetical protein KatS3mg041_0016 [Bacteroidota bacterium]